MTKDVAGKAAEKGGAFVTDTKQHFQREGAPEELRAQSDDLAYRAMDRLFVDDPEAHVLFDRCFGYAVFEMRQVSFGVTAGYGYGVARERESDIPTYMKMATGGAGYSLGVGGFAFQLVMLFEDEPTYRRFLTEGVEGRAEANSMVGRSDRLPGQGVSRGAGHLQAHRRWVQDRGRPGRDALLGRRRPHPTPARRGGH